MEVVSPWPVVSSAGHAFVGIRPDVWGFEIDRLYATVEADLLPFAGRSGGVPRRGQRGPKR